MSFMVAKTKASFGAAGTPGSICIRHYSLEKSEKIAFFACTFTAGYGKIAS